MSRYWVRFLGVAVAYVVACKLGLALAYLNASVTAVWPGTGIAIGALLLFGSRFWPAVLAGAVIVNFGTTGNVFAAVGISLGNTLEAVVANHLINRYAAGRFALERTVSILKLTGLIAVTSAWTSASIGVANLWLVGLVHRPELFTTWLTWWMGNVSGALLILPLILHWANHPRLKWDTAHIAEAAALGISAVTVALVVFDRDFASGANHFPIEFLCTPIFLWVAFRFSPRAAATVLVPMLVIAVRGTLHDSGPFVRGSWNESLLILQGFMSFSAVMTLVLAAEIAERRAVESRFRRLAVSDPMTGLPNYRQLIVVLDAEIRRSQRMLRPFAVLFLDLDGLKKINDRYGHLAGSRALMRLADALRIASRSMDTAARFGGDEFALVLPETGDAAARQVGIRICERIATDDEDPPLSVSVGVAVYPRDGETADALIGTADKALYVAKRRGGGTVIMTSGETDEERV
jgi:diguanylate cyclase (GGDEF)-like protein